MSSFIQFVARDYLGILARLHQRFSSARREFGNASHARTPGIVADLLAGFEIFLTFAVESKAIDQIECDRNCETFRRSAMAAVHEQENHQQATEPTTVYFGLLKTGIACGRAYVADASTGGPPSQFAAWGWKGVSEKPSGVCIGWTEEEVLYIEPNAACLVAQDVARITGESLPFSKRTLHRILEERGLLQSREVKRNTYAIRKRINGVCREVLHLPLSILRGGIDPEIESSSSDRRPAKTGSN